MHIKSQLNQFIMDWFGLDSDTDTDDMEQQEAIKLREFLNKQDVHEDTWPFFPKDKRNAPYKLFVKLVNFGLQTRWKFVRLDEKGLRTFLEANYDKPNIITGIVKLEVLQKKCLWELQKEYENLEKKINAMETQLIAQTKDEQCREIARLNMRVYQLEKKLKNKKAWHEEFADIPETDPPTILSRLRAL